MGKVSIKAEDPIRKDEGVKISCIVHKNRFAGMKNPFTTAYYFARYDSGIDNSVNLPTYLLDAGIVRQAGAWWYYEDENGNPYTVNGMECKFRSKAAFLEALKENEVLNKELNDKLEESYSSKDNSVHSLTAEEIQKIEQENKKIENEMGKIDREEAALDIEELFEDNE